MSAPKNNKNHYKHGLSHTRIDNIYKSMIDRCLNPKSRNFHKYGAKGIGVCDEWKSDNTKFFEWSFANGYAENLTLDRIDNNQGYSPNNCRWVSYKTQNNNRTNNHYVEAFGKRKTIAEWSDITGFKQSTIWERLKRGLPPEIALTKEIQTK